ncbi:uncharacterized protein LOC107628038 [Arachis ipaensis]|uniref:uncharacterized protein LOC107628038 n=1 Tax=Arachis ipaensis TaxID=130454 RepID=UPI0007AFD1AF|nr:uncharacterized protein LOC107628038 [Arachis ipaensis]
MNTLRILLAVAAAKDWFVHQLDVNTAFLHGDLEEEVYMKPLPGLNVSNLKLICKLEKSLYGLKQASRQWNSKLANTLIKFGYTQSKHDYNLFTKVTGSGFTAVIVYVDDLVLAGNCIKEITALKQHLHDLFKIKDIGELKFFLGFEFARSKRGITMYQRKYCLDLLEEYGMLGSKSCSTSMDYTSHLSKESGDPMPNASEYRRLLERLLYLTNTRLEISFAVGKLSQFLDCPTNKHFQAALRVLKYLKSAPAQGLLFKTESDLQLTGFSDSDWATCPDTRRYISGYCFFLGTTLITWKSKKQVTVACSSAEAEYRALAASTCEAQWIVFILQDLTVPILKPAAIYCDNQSALHIAANPVFHERTKHIEADSHIVRDKAQAQVIKLLPISTLHQTTDIFTKVLSPAPFSSCHSKLGLCDLHKPNLEGGV